MSASCSQCLSTHLCTAVGRGHKISTEALLVTSRKLICISENVRQVLPPLEEAELFTTSKVKNTLSCLRNSTGGIFFLFTATHNILLWFINLSLLQCGFAVPIYLTSKCYLDLNLNIMLSFCLQFDILNFAWEYDFRRRTSAVF